MRALLFLLGAGMLLTTIRQTSSSVESPRNLPRWILTSLGTDEHAPPGTTNSHKNDSLVPNTDAATPNNNYDTDPWPGLPPSHQLGHPLVRIGHSHVDHARQLLLDHWHEFLHVYAHRPDRNNICGMRVNHAFGLWITVTQVQPTSMIESGVNAGCSTYLMRHAAPHAHIYAMDPSDTPICHPRERWIDPTGNTTYFTGPEHFQDLQQIDWQSYMDQGQLDPNTTLVFQDDHTNGYEHVLTCVKFGFRHVVVEDNYRVHQGGNAADRAGFTPKQLLARVDADTRFFYNLLDVHAKFPPLFPPSLAHHNTPIPYRSLYDAFLTPTQSLDDVHAPLLRPDVRPRDQELLVELCASHRDGDLPLCDPTLSDKYSYFQWMQYVHLCYLRFKPDAMMGPYLRTRIEVNVQASVSR